jgi:hypothetical protein
MGIKHSCIVPGCSQLLEDDQPCPLHPNAAQYVSEEAGAEMVLATMTRAEARRTLYDLLIQLDSRDPQPDDAVGEWLEQIEDEDTYRYVDALLWAATAPPERRWLQQDKLGGPAHYHMLCVVKPPCSVCAALEP